MEFNKIVKKLSKFTKTVLDLEDVAEFVDPEFSKGEEGKRATYKLAYRLRSVWILKPIRNGLYLLRKPNSERAASKVRADFEDMRAIEDAYWKIVKKLISKNCGSNYVLAGPKSLEVRMRDLSIPDTLIVYTRDYDASVVVSSRHKVVFKTAKSGSKTGRTNAYPVFSKFSETVEIDKMKFKVAGIEHAVLDSLIAHKDMPESDVRMVEKFLSKYSKTLRREILGELVSFKYLTAVNRLREISRDRGDTATYEKALDVVKREGGNCFVTWKGTNATEKR